MEEKTDIIVDDKSISESGPMEELTAMCPMLKTLHMTNNLLKDWESVSLCLSLCVCLPTGFDGVNKSLYD